MPAIVINVHTLANGIPGEMFSGGSLGIGVAGVKVEAVIRITLSVHRILIGNARDIAIRVLV